VKIGVIICLLLAMTGAAQAQGRKPAMTGNIGADIVTDLHGGVAANTKQPLTGNLPKDLQALWAKLVAASDKDLAYAAALATAANTPASAVRLQCWNAILAANQKANGVGLKNPDGTVMTRPDPAVFSDVETFAEIVDSLSPQGTLFTSCAGAAQLVGANTMTFINAAITGVAGIAALHPAL
jgi:hypothetical protein